jgi:type I restriction enzyme, S subunit
LKQKWSIVELGEVLTQYQEYIEAPEHRLYPKLSVRLYGKGVVLDTPTDGSSLKMKRHQLAKPGQVILSEIWGKKGAIGFVPPEGDGALCTSHFFLFDVCTSKLSPAWLQAIFQANYLAEQLGYEAKGTTGYAAVRPKTLLACKIPLPPLEEQKRIVARIEELATKIDEIRCIQAKTDTDLSALLRSSYDGLIKNAPRRPLGEIAPLQRRLVAVRPDTDYPQVSVRSFGKGPFHRPPLIGREITWEKPYWVYAGDILISNIKAWEGAIAVATAADHYRVASHRYLTCVPIPNVATSNFICFHLLTDEGLFAVGEASPGSADRNRTLGVKALLRIPIPVPEYRQQFWFDELCLEVRQMRQLHAERSIELNALLPSVLSKAFAGEL